MQPASLNSLHNIPNNSPFLNPYNFKILYDYILVGLSLINNSSNKINQFGSGCDVAGLCTNITLYKILDLLCANVVSVGWKVLIAFGIP